MHLFFCGNPRENEMVDNIYHVRIDPDGTQTAAKSVLRPGPAGSFDDHHVCDPSVIEGTFGMDGRPYRYAMFYLANSHGVKYNEIGVAFSDRLDADQWTKYPKIFVKKPWEGNVDIGATKKRRAWGVGQPSALSLDRQSEVLLTYTQDDGRKTTVMWFRCDLSNVDRYVQPEAVEITGQGLSDLDRKKKDYTCNIDFAFDRKTDAVFMIRPVQPNSRVYPTYINTTLEAAVLDRKDFMNSTGAWTPLKRIGPTDTGYPCNHNAGIERNSFGEVEDPDDLVIYYTVSKTSPDVQATPDRHAEWTYHIWKCHLKSVRETTEVP